MSKVTTTLTTKLEMDGCEVELSNNDGQFTFVICNKFLMEHVSVTLNRNELQQISNLINKGGI